MLMEASPLTMDVHWKRVFCWQQYKTSRIKQKGIIKKNLSALTPALEGAALTSGRGCFIAPIRHSLLVSNVTAFVSGVPTFCVWPRGRILINARWRYSALVAPLPLMILFLDGSNGSYQNPNNVHIKVTSELSHTHTLLTVSRTVALACRRPLILILEWLLLSRPNTPSRSVPIFWLEWSTKHALPSMYKNEGT